MNTKLVLSASALVMGLAGIAASFAPSEVLTAVGVAPTTILPVLVQLLGATLFAFAMVNWTARGSLIGGIYNRPIAIGNLTHFVVGALALLRAGIWIAAAIYAVFAIAFAMIFFRSPVERQ